MSIAALLCPAVRLSAFYAAMFLVAGIQLPFWPVWLAARGLSAREIGIVLAAAIWVRVFATPAIGAISDRLGARRAVMGCSPQPLSSATRPCGPLGIRGLGLAHPRRTDGAIGADAPRRHSYPRHFPLGRARLWAHPRLGLGELYPRFARQRCRPLVGFGRASPPSGARCLRTCTARMPAFRRGCKRATHLCFGVLTPSRRPCHVGSGRALCALCGMGLSLYGRSLRTWAIRSRRSLPAVTPLIGTGRAPRS